MASNAQFASELLSENEGLREIASEIEIECDFLIAKVAALKKAKRALESKLSNRDQTIIITTTQRDQATSKSK